MLQLTVDPCLTWIGGFTVAGMSKSGDPESEVSSNLMEFVLNGNPRISDTIILTNVDLSSTNFTFSYVRRVDSLGVPQVFQYGSDLGGWTDAAIPAFTGTTTACLRNTLGEHPSEARNTIAKYWLDWRPQRKAISVTLSSGLPNKNAPRSPTAWVLDVRKARR